MRIVNETKETVLAVDGRLANTPLSRMRGLLGRDNLPEGEGLVLKPCDSVHTLFMRFPIDVVFVNHQNEVIKTYSCLKPWRISGIFLKAAFCIELPSGIIAKTNTQIGDKILIS